MNEIIDEYCKTKCPFREENCLIVDLKNDLCIIEHYQQFLDEK